MNKLRVAFLALVIVVLPTKSFGFTFNLVQSPNSNYVDVFIDTEGKSFSAISGDISISNNAKVVRIEDGDSVVKNWISRPVAGNNVIFAGIIPGGFSGYLNAIGSDKFGLVFRIILESNISAKNNESITLSLKNSYAILNDGEGNTINADNKSLQIPVSSLSNEYVQNDTDKPEVFYYISNDPNLLEGQKVLIFSVIDNKSGFKEAYIKEGRGEFKLATSPYVLSNQSVGSIIILKVSDNAGNTKEVIIKTGLVSYFTSYVSLHVTKIIGGLILLIIILIYLRYKNNTKLKKELK